MEVLAITSSLGGDSRAKQKLLSVLVMDYKDREELEKDEDWFLEWCRNVHEKDYNRRILIRRRAEMISELEALKKNFSNDAQINMLEKELENATKLLTEKEEIPSDSAIVSDDEESNEGIDIEHLKNMQCTLKLMGRDNSNPRLLKILNEGIHYFDVAIGAFREAIKSSQSFSDDEMEQQNIDITPTSGRPHLNFSLLSQASNLFGCQVSTEYWLPPLPHSFSNIFFKILHFNSS